MRDCAMAAWLKSLYIVTKNDAILFAHLPNIQHSELHFAPVNQCTYSRNFYNAASEALYIIVNTGFLLSRTPKECMSYQVHLC